MIWILMTIVLVMYTHPKQCYLHPLLQNRITTSLATFQSGISLKMLQKAKETVRTCTVKIIHHRV